MDEFQQAMAALGQAFVAIDTDGDGQPDTMVPANQGVTMSRPPARTPAPRQAEMRSYTPTMGENINSLISRIAGPFYGQRAQSAAETLGITAPYDAGRSIGSGIMNESPRETAYGAALLGLSALPGAGMGAAAARRLPGHASQLIDEAYGVVNALGNRTGGQKYLAKGNAIQSQVDRLPVNSMVPNATLARTGGAAALGGAVAGLSQPFDPQSYQDWLRVAGGAALGAAGERLGSHAAAAPAINHDRRYANGHWSRVDASDVAGLRAELSAALRVKQRPETLPPLLLPKASPPTSSTLGPTQTGTANRAKSRKQADPDPTMPPIKSRPYTDDDSQAVRGLMGRTAEAGGSPVNMTTSDVAQTLFNRNGAPLPSSANIAGRHSSTMDYLRALEAAGVPITREVIEAMPKRIGKALLYGTAGAAGLGLNSLYDPSMGAP